MDLPRMRGIARRVLLWSGTLYAIRRVVHGTSAQQLLQQEFYNGLLRRGQMVFDVGANVGDRTALYLDVGCPVIAVEPQRSCAQHLRQRFRFSRRVTVVEAALSDRAGTSTLYECETGVLSSMSREHIERVSRDRFKSETWNEGVAVETATCDALVSRYGHPSFIKIDVEGYEPVVLRGLSAPVECLSFEYTAETIDETVECVMLLKALSSDYLFNFCDGEDLRFVNPQHVPAERFLQEIVPQLSLPAAWGDVYAIRAARAEQLRNDRTLYRGPAATCEA